MKLKDSNTRQIFARSVALALLGLTAGMPYAFAGPVGPAAPALAAYMAATKIPCYTQAGEGSCTIKPLDPGVHLFHRKPDACTDEAAAFVEYQYDATGNGMDQMAIVLRLVAGKWIVVGRVDNTTGSSPRNVRFSPGAITYIGTVVGANDNRANPTGKGSFRLAVGERSVSFVSDRAEVVLCRMKFDAQPKPSQHVVGVAAIIPVGWVLCWHGGRIFTAIRDRPMRITTELRTGRTT